MARQRLYQIALTVAPTGQQLTTACPPTTGRARPHRHRRRAQRPQRLYALVDAGALSGLYRSDDAGMTWKTVNSEERVTGRGSDFAVRQRRSQEPT